MGSTKNTGIGWMDGWAMVFGGAKASREQIS